jgi:NitT/TauT family transport system permease protein
MTSRVKSIAKRQVGFLILLAVWWAVATMGLLPERAFPPPDRVALRFVEDLSAVIWTHLRATVLTAAMSLVIGVALGLVIALWLASSSISKKLAQPYIAFGNAAPRIALAPIFILWFGIGYASKVALGVSMIAFVMLLTMLAAFTNANRVFVLSVRAMGGGGLHVWRRVIWPSSMPQFFAALKVSVSLAFLASVAGEMLLSAEGLGWLIRRRASGMDLDGTFSVLAFIALLSVMANAVMSAVSARKLRWL